jgi:hypothetical protein
VNGLFSFSFTEPVTNVSTLRVSLTELGTGDELTIELIGSASFGVGPVGPSTVITALCVFRSIVIADSGRT